jgi:hypothetical protein
MYDIVSSMNDPFTIDNDNDNDIDSSNDEIQTIVNNSLDRLMEHVNDLWGSGSDGISWIEPYRRSNPQVVNWVYNFGGDLRDILTDDEYNMLNVCVYSDMSDKSKEMYKECNICQESFEPTTEITELTCNHIFCNDCIKRWLTKCKCVCPMCKKDQRPSEPNPEPNPESESESESESEFESESE